MPRWVGLLMLFCPVTTLMAAEPKTDHCVVLISVDGLSHVYMEDPLAEMPTIRKLARQGAQARGGMVASFPTVTWPNHTTLVTGVPPARHGVLGNNYLDRETGKSVTLITDPVYDKDEIVKVPTIYDVAAEAGLKTSGILWPASRNARSLTWTVPDMGGDGWSKYGTPEWMAELRAAGIPVDKHGLWAKEQTGGVQRDWMYTRLLSHVLKHHHPNLVLIHLVEVDHVEHRTGPQTPEAYWAASFADDRVRDIVEAVQQSERADHTTIIVASDHGFFPIDKDIRTNVLFRKHVDEKGQPAVRTVTQGGASMIYLVDESRRADLLSIIKGQLSELEGVEKVFEPAEYDQIGQFTPAQDRRAPDLWVAAKSGFAFSDSTQGDAVITPRNAGGTHGYMPEHPALFATLVMSGAGIRPGVDLGQVSNMDVAPTIAALLGLEMPTAEGKVLQAALQEK